MTSQPYSIGNVSNFSSFAPEFFNGTGAQTNFTLSAALGQNGWDIYVGGTRQYPSIDYTISGTTLTFTSAPASGTNNIMAVAKGNKGTINTVGADTIDATELADLTGGVKTDIETVAYAANVTPSGSAEYQKLMVATGNWQMDCPSDSKGFSFIIEVENDNAGGVTFTAGSNVHIVEGTYDTSDNAINLIGGTYYPSASRLYIAIKQKP